MIQFFMQVKNQIFRIQINIEPIELIESLFEFSGDARANFINNSQNQQEDNYEIIYDFIDNNDEKGFKKWLYVGDSELHTNKLKQDNKIWMEDILIPLLIDEEKYRWIKFVQEYIDKN